MVKEFKNKLLVEVKEYVIKVKMEIYDFYLCDFFRLELRVMRFFNSSFVVSVEILRVGGV